MNTNPKIAIIGAGLAGLACAYFLQNKAQLTLFDEKGIGGGASGVAAGLLHPFGGVKARLNWQGQEGMAAALNLIEKVAPGSIVLRGIERIPISEEQRENFIESANRFEGLEWKKDSLWIAEGIAVDIPIYLEALWNQIEAEFIQEKVESLSELHEYNQIILAAGAGIFSFPEAKDLPLRKLKGQLLKIQIPKEIPLPTHIRTAKVYIVPNVVDHTCTMGATFEKEFKKEGPDLELAKAKLLEGAYHLWPPLKQGKILSCEAGIRVSSKHHKPLAIRIDERICAVTALSSKGLLYHAYMAKEIKNII